MSMFTGFESKRNSARIAGVSAVSVLALAALAIAQPAQCADLEYHYGERHEYRVPVHPPQQRYGEYYERRVPAHAPYAHDRGQALEYRVIVYPPKPVYGGPHDYPPPAFPPSARYGEDYEYEYDGQPAVVAPRRYAPRPVYREARSDRRYAEPYEPYTRYAEPEPLLPPGLVGQPRRTVVVETPNDAWHEAPPRW